MIPLVGLGGGVADKEFAFLGYPYLDGMLVHPLLGDRIEAQEPIGKVCRSFDPAQLSIHQAGRYLRASSKVGYRPWCSWR